MIGGGCCAPPPPPPPESPGDIKVSYIGEIEVFTSFLLLVMMKQPYQKTDTTLIPPGRKDGRR